MIDWTLGRAQSIRLFWAGTDVYIFHCRYPMPILCNTQTTVERQYFSAMKKRITWNSGQTWVTEIVKNHSLVRWQRSAYGAKPGSECYVIDRFIRTIAEWSEYCALLDAFRDLRVVRNKYELSMMGVSKESISKFLIRNRFHVKLCILSPESYKQSLQVKC